MKPLLLVTGLWLLSKPLLQAEESSDQFTRIDDSIPLLQEKVRQLTAAEELLKAKLKEALSAQPAAVDPRELARANEKIKSLEKEIDVLKVSLEKADSKPDKPVDPAVLEATRKDLAAARQNLAQQTEMSAALTLAKEALEKRLQAFINGAEIKMLRDEIESLKRQAHDLKADEAGAKADAQKAGGSQPGSTAKVRLLERELAEVKAVAQSNAAMVSALQTALQARKVPFSAEELALVQTPEPGPGNPAIELRSADFSPLPGGPGETAGGGLKSAPLLARTAPNSTAVGPGKGSSGSPPATVEPLGAEAERAFAARPYEEAERIVSLGVVLAEKGLREPAESAFRRAIQLAPGHAEAHYNLALIYATQPTPALEPARWHYQKSLESGHAKDAKLERMLKR